MLAERVIAIIAATRRIPQEAVTLDSSFQELEIDSLDSLEIVFQLEDNFNIRIGDEEAQGIRSVRDIVVKLETALGDQGAAAVPAG